MSTRVLSLGLVVFTGVLVFIQFFYLNLVPRLFSKVLGISLPAEIYWFLGGALLLLAIVKASKWVNACVSERRWHIKWADVASAALLVLATILVWWVFCKPYTSVGPHTLGDEDYHFNTVFVLQDFFEGKGQAGRPPYVALRYPSATQFFFWLTNNDWLGDIASPFHQRLPLLMLLILSIFLLFVLLRGVFQMNIQSAVFLTVGVGLTPLYFAYTMDKYLDLPHPILFFMTLCGIYLMEKGRMGGLILAVSSVVTLSLVRDSAAPSVFIFSCAIGWLSYQNLGFSKAKSFITAAMSSLPFFLYFLIRSKAGQSQAGRLSLANVLKQDYLSFLEVAPVHFPLIGLIAFVGAFLYLGSSHRFTVLVCYLSVVGQMAIYSVFSASWMPWSRNALMFSGQISFLTVLLAKGCLASTRKVRSFYFAALAVSIFANFYLIVTELGRSQFFHENEVYYDYHALYQEMKRVDSLKGQPIYMQMPSRATMQYKYFEDHKQFDLRPTWHDRGAFPSLTSFIKMVPSDARFMLFHWRKVYSKLPVSRGFDTPRPNFTGFNVLAEVVSPMGDAGVVLIEKHHSLEKIN